MQRSAIMHKLHVRSPITHRVVPQSHRANVKRPLFPSKCLLRRSDSVSHRGTDGESNVCFECAPAVAERAERRAAATTRPHNSADRLAPIARDSHAYAATISRHSAPTSLTSYKSKTSFFNSSPRSRDPRRLLKEKLISIIKYHFSDVPKCSSNYLIGIELTCSVEIIKL